MAARYAKAPSYTQLQAEEARVAVRAAEIATKVALEAQAAAETVLAELHAATQEKPSRGPAVVQSIAQPVRHPEPEPVEVSLPVQPEIEETAVSPVVVSPVVVAPAVVAPVAVSPVVVAPAVEVQAAPAEVAAIPVVAEPAVERRPYGVRWDPDLPVRAAERQPEARRQSDSQRTSRRQADSHRQEEFALSVEDWWSPAEASENLRDTPIEVAENEPGHANLIQFPRELVATRKMRPRLAEPSSAGTEEGQLSIFEVDPSTVSTEAAAPAVAVLDDVPSSIWNRPEWSGMQLDKHPAAKVASAPVATSDAEPLPVASIGLRMLAAVVDCSLILASFVTIGFLAAHNFDRVPVGKTAELEGVVAMAAIGLLYYAFFFALAISTPGMRYAGIGLCTFDEQTPTRGQLWRRLGALTLSLLPVGLGLVWSIFDEEHLSWHDRFSQTYLRKL